MAWAAMLWGCGRVADPVSLVAAGDLDGAVAMAEERGAPEPWGAWLGRWDALNREREAVRTASARLVVEAAEEAFAQRRLDDAVAALGAAGLGGGEPDDPRLLRVAEGVRLEAEARARAGDIGRAASLFHGLAAAWSGDPDRRRMHLDAADRLARRAAIASRYEPEALAATRALHRGIRAPMVGAALGVLDGEYLRPLPVEAMAREAVEHVRLFVADGGVRSAFHGLEQPGLADAARALGVGGGVDAVAALERRLLDLVDLLAGAGVPEETAVYEVMTGAVAALDPWTRVVWPAQVRAWEDHHEGVRHGVGLELRVVGTSVVCDAPIFESPAYAAGIHQGDVLVSVDGHALAAVGPEARIAAAGAALYGQDGTTVELGLERDGATLRVPLLRGPVAEPVVRGYRRGADNRWDSWLDRERSIAYVRVAEFRPHTDDAVALAVSGLGARGIVLDLRGNPGGDVDAAVGTADLFLAQGVMATLTGRVPLDLPPAYDEGGNELPAWNLAVPGHPLEGTEVVVLIDGETASAAEIVAGALQQLGGAPVVGQRSYGKGLSQALRADPALGFAVEVTNLQWQLPDGRNIHRHSGSERWGIDPSVELPLTAAERYLVDGLRRERERLRVHGDGTPVPPVEVARRPGLPELSVDPQVWAGLLVLRARLGE